MSEKPRVYLDGGKEDRPEDDWREDIDWNGVVLEPDECCSDKGMPGNVHCDCPCHKEHIAANHRGDDIDTIGSFPCECRDDDLADALDEIDKIFRDSQTRANRSREMTVDQAWKEFFRKP